MMESSIEQVIRGRRTIGSFLPDLPPASEIEAAIEWASWAPNHKKTEPWRIVWLGPETAAAVVELNSHLIAKTKGFAEAEKKRLTWSTIPGWLVVTSVRSADSFRQEEDYAASCCFIQNLLLALWSKKIGTKWSTGDVTRDPQFHELLGIDPAQERVVGLIWNGYPAVIPEQNRQSPNSFVRKLK